MNSIGFVIRLVAIVILLGTKISSVFAQVEKGHEDETVQNVVLDGILKRSMLEEVRENGGRIVKHIVERGETWKSIASMYFIEEDELQCANSLYKTCYAGLEIDVPVYLTEEELRIRRLELFDTNYLKAKGLMNKKDYSKAAKIYTEIINSSSASIEAFYQRGLANYQRGKYSKAIDDFSYVIKNDRNNRYPDAFKYKSKSDKLLAERREERAAAWGELIQMGAQVASNIAAAKQQAEQNKQVARNQVATNANGGSALNTQIPEAFNPQRVAMMSRPVYTYDENGNLMVSNPGFAQALGEMNAEIQKTTQQASVRLMASGDPVKIAQAQSLQVQAHTHDWTTKLEQQKWATPMYPEVWSEMESSGEEQIEDLKDDNDDRVIGYSDNTKKSITEKNGITKTSKKESTVGKTNKKDSKIGNDKKLDSKLQYHIGGVSSDDYKVIRRVSLYIRDGSKAKSFLTNKELCQKGSTYYIKIENRYYLVGYSNWNRFNRSISYASTSVYFNM